MALQVLWGADDHTAQDGPYTRLMKTRKWIYLSAIFSILLAAGHYDEAAVKPLLRVVSAPTALIVPAVLAGLIYLLIQYGLLLRQLLSCYDIIMDERLHFRRAEDLGKAKDRLRLAKDEVLRRNLALRTEIENALVKVKSELLEIYKRQEKTEMLLNSSTQRGTSWRDRTSLELGQLRSDSAILEGQMNELKDRLVKLPAKPDYTGDPDVADAQATLDQLRSQDPGDRRGYRSAEYLIDTLRLAPPVLVGAFAAGKLGWHLLFKV